MKRVRGARVRPPFIKMRHLDLFSGIGGFALAAQWMGWETVGFCEKDKYAKRVLGRHWPNVPIIDDIRDIKEPVGCDIITGGFPCQPFSVAGKQKSKADDRYLWPEMLRVIALERPAWVVGENVAGIVGLALDQTLSDLEAQSYSSRAFILPACAVDAPHRRDRVWIVAHTSSPGIRNQSKEVGEHKPGRSCQTLRQANRETSSNRIDPAGQTQGSAMAKSSSTRRGRCGQEEIRRESPLSGKSQRKSEDLRGGWPVEPQLGRVVDGLPNRSHRAKALGNAIVPQIAYKLFQAIHNDHCNIR